MTSPSQEGVPLQEWLQALGLTFERISGDSIEEFYREPRQQLVTFAFYEGVLFGALLAARVPDAAAALREYTLKDKAYEEHAYATLIDSFAQYNPAWRLETV